MDKIVKTPETVQIHKVDQGKLKIQILIDWSISAGLLGNKEYKCICTRSQHLKIIT